MLMFLVSGVILFFLADQGWLAIATSGGMLTEFVLPLVCLVVLLQLGLQPKFAAKNGIDEELGGPFWSWWPWVSLAMILFLVFVKYNPGPIWESALQLGSNALGLITEAMYRILWIYTVAGFVLSFKEILSRVFKGEL